LRREQVRKLITHQFLVMLKILCHARGIIVSITQDNANAGMIDTRIKTAHMLFDHQDI